MPTATDLRSGQGLSDQPGFQMFFQCGHDGHGLVVVVGGADAIKSGFAGDDLEEDPTVVAASVGGDDPAILDGEWWETIGSLRNFLCAGDREQRKRGRGGLDEFSTIHPWVSLWSGVKTNGTSALRNEC